MRSFDMELARAFSLGIAGRCVGAGESVQFKRRDNDPGYSV